jgi:predicted ATPase
VEEILKSLVAAGEIFYEDGTWNRRPLNELHIPRSLYDALQQRTHELSESVRQVLRLAAIAGRRFDFALLQQLTQHDEQQLLTLMKELMAAQLVVEESEERFAFRHALTREAVYAQLLARERKKLHGTIAETMERLYASAEAHLAELAYHFYEAGLWERALFYTQRAGEKAQRLYSLWAAIEHFTRALDAAHHLGVLPSPAIYRARGQAYATRRPWPFSSSSTTLTALLRRLICWAWRVTWVVTWCRARGIMNRRSRSFASWTIAWASPPAWPR